MAPDLLHIPFRRLRAVGISLLFGARLYLLLLRTRAGRRQDAPMAAGISALDHACYPALCEWLRRALQRAPYWANGHYYLALFSLGLERTAAAELSLRAYCELRPAQAESAGVAALRAQCLRRRE